MDDEEPAELSPIPDADMLTTGDFCIETAAAEEDDEDEEPDERPNMRRGMLNGSMLFLDLICSFSTLIIRSTKGTRPRCKNSLMNVRMRSWSLRVRHMPCRGAFITALGFSDEAAEANSCCCWCIDGGSFAMLVSPVSSPKSSNG